MNDESNEYLRRIAESTDLLARLALEALRGDRTQKDMILYLDGLGISPGRIADLLGTTTNTVYPTLSRARPKKNPKKKASPRDLDEGQGDGR